MSDRKKIQFAEIKQDRSKKTLDNILEAANNLIERADTKFFTSRSLASESGYSLGTLNKRLVSVDNVFMYLIKKGQKQHIRYASRIISEIEPDRNLECLITRLVDAFFAIMKKINPNVIRYYEHRKSLKIGLIEDYDRVDSLVPAFLEAARKNRTNTFRQLSETELRLILRASLSFLERPFVYNDPIAGTMEHRRITIENCIRMLGC